MTSMLVWITEDEDDERRKHQSQPRSVTLFNQSQTIPVSSLKPT